MSESNLHPISEMALHQQFMTQLNSSDASLFGIDPTLLPSHLAGYHGDDGDDGEEQDGDDVEGGEGEGEAMDREAGDIPTPPFFSGELPPAAVATDGRRGPTKPKNPAGVSGAGRMTRLNDPRAQALMQLVPMPSQLPPGSSSDANAKFSPINANGIPSEYAPVDPRYAAPGTAGMIPHAMMMPLAPGQAGPGGNVGLSNGNPNDQVGTWTESVNAYWQPMGLPAFQAPVLVSGGLAATIRDARLAWMVGESVCGHPSCLGRRFERKTNLLKHLLTHVEARPYVCQVPGCDQAFKQKWLLDRHGRVHAANKEVHKCPVPGCNTTCSSLYNLRNHELVHSETKKFLCDFENCGRTFATARNLRLHQRTHTGDKPFACDYPGCGMRYHRPAHLKRHQEVHSDNPNKPKPRKSRSANPPSATAPQMMGPSTSTGGGGVVRRKKALASELDVEIDELAGDGDTQMARSSGDVEDGPGVAGGLRARPRRAAAVAAVEANRSKRWDEDIDLGDEEGEDEDDEDDEDEEDAGAHLQDEGGDDDDDDDEEEEEEDPTRKKGQPGRRRANGQGRAPPIISSSGGPTYGSNGLATPFSNARATYMQGMQGMPGMMLVDGSGNAMMDPEMQRRHGMGQVHPMLVPMHARHGGEEMDDASPGLAPAAEGNEDGDEEE